MTLFVGGPYDGEDLPIDPSRVRSVHLPSQKVLAEQPDDSGETCDMDWSHHYAWDETAIPPAFRYQGPGR